MKGNNGNQKDITRRTVKLVGFAPIMFDRYGGDNKTQLAPEQKMYFLPDGKTVCLPAANLLSFLAATNTESAAKQFGGKQYKALARALLGFIQFEPLEIPIIRNGKPIVFTGFVNDRDDKAGIFVHRTVARLDKGIPNPKVRPTIELPWELGFTLRMFKNDVFDEPLLKSLFERGGLSIGLGTFRGLFGKFTVDVWE